MSEARDSHFIADNQRQVEQLSKLGWYHSIELPDGSVIPGHQSIELLRTRLRQFHIPEDLTGKRVLDIGAWDGWFSFEMERRGASVLAVDSAKNTRLLEARTLLGSRIDYHVADICHLTAAEVGTFDIVLFLGVLYHLKHPLLALENVCGMCRDLACIESFVTDGDPAAVPLMEFYETTELRGQLDNWCGPNAACLLAFTRTAGFARVQLESVLAERAHVSAYRKWSAPEGDGEAPRILCVENSTTHDHNFSSAADDYVSFYFTHEGIVQQRPLPHDSGAAGLAPDGVVGLAPEGNAAGSEHDGGAEPVADAQVRAAFNCDNVFPEIGGYGSRPMYVAGNGTGWQAACKLPPGLDAGWHEARLRVEGSRYSAPLRIGVNIPGSDRRRWRARRPSELQVTGLSDGKTFESRRIRVGDGSALSVWVKGLPETAVVTEIRVRLNGTDLPAVWLAPQGESRQINALLPAGLEPGDAAVSVVFRSFETDPVEVELHR